MDIIRMTTDIGTIVAKPYDKDNAKGIEIILEGIRKTPEYKLAAVEANKETDAITMKTWSDDGVMMVDVRKRTGVATLPEINNDSPMVYICSPYAGKNLDERAVNVENAKRYARFAIINGYVPFVAHLGICELLNDDIRTERDMGIRVDRAIISRCSEIWVFGDIISAGMRSEIDTATELDIPIRYFTTDCKIKN